MFGLGTGEIVIIGAAIFLLFGARKLPQLGSSVAQGIKNFQKGMKEDTPEKSVEDKEKV